MVFEDLTMVPPSLEYSFLNLIVSHAFWDLRKQQRSQVIFWGVEWTTKMAIGYKWDTHGYDSMTEETHTP